MTEQDIYLSVILPAYQERDRIGRTLLEIDKYLKAKDFSYEILVVVDGSPDGTADIARNYAHQVANLRVIENPKNYGKGYTVRRGLLETSGRFRLFLDSDGSTSITHWDTFVPALEQGFDVVIGSRDLPDSFIQIHQPKYREWMGNMGNWLIRIVLGLWRFADTQCGFKILSARAAEAVASRMVVDRFGFDFELLVLAKKLGFRIEQLPVRWLNEEGSTVSLTGKNGFIQVLIDLWKTRLRLWKGAYRLKESDRQPTTDN